MWRCEYGGELGSATGRGPDMLERHPCWKIHKAPCILGHIQRECHDFIAHPAKYLL